MNKNVKNSIHTNFYIEAVLLIFIFLLITTILVSVMGLAKKKSDHAKNLENAVAVSEDCMEVFMGSMSFEEFCFVLDVSENLEVVESNDEMKTVKVFYDREGRPLKNGPIYVVITVSKEDTSYGAYVSSSLKAYDEKIDSLVYELTSGKYVKGGF